MMKEKETLKQIYDEGAALAGKLLEEGEQVAFITLGDPTVDLPACIYINGYKEPDLKRVLSREYLPFVQLQPD